MSTIPLSGPFVSAGPIAALPPNITGVVNFKLALDGVNFTRWRNYINPLLVHYHVEDHVRDSAANQLSDPAWSDDDNTIVLWLFSTITGDFLDIMAPAGLTTHSIWARLHFM